MARDAFAECYVPNLLEFRVFSEFGKDCAEIFLFRTIRQRKARISAVKIRQRHPSRKNLGTLTHFLQQTLSDTELELAMSTPQMVSLK